MADLELARLSALELAEAMATADRAYADLNLRLREPGGCSPRPAPPGTRTRPPWRASRSRPCSPSAGRRWCDRASTHDRFAARPGQPARRRHRSRRRRPAGAAAGAGRVPLDPRPGGPAGPDLSRRPARRDARRGPDRHRAVGRPGLLGDGLGRRRPGGARGRRLVAAVGKARAPWVAEALRPTNLAARPGGVPEFPDPAASDQHPRGRAHPARPVLRAHRAGRCRAGDPVRPAGPRRGAGRAGRPGRPERARPRRRGPAADRRVAGVAGRLRRGRAARHGTHDRRCRAPTRRSAG